MASQTKSCYISDVYAMGGSPLLAIGILGWPIEKLAASIASEVLQGARAICKEAGIPLAGGHSIDSPEPIFGLAVTGRVDIKRLKTNAGAKAGDLIYLTKGLGVGILTTAEKKGRSYLEKLLLQKMAIIHTSLTTTKVLQVDIILFPSATKGKRLQRRS